MRILVTGSTGRVGANLVKSLLSLGYEVASLVYPGDPLERKLKGLKTDILYADLRDINNLRKAIEGVEVVIHTAALMNETQVSRPDFFDINAKGCFNLLEVIREVGTRIRKVVYFSSTAAYDDYSKQEQPIKETNPLHPLALYGLTKVLNETMVLNYRYQFDLPMVILRPQWIMACDEILSPWTAGGLVHELKTWSAKPNSALYAGGEERPWEVIERVASSMDVLAVPYGPDGRVWRTQVTDVRDVVRATLLALERDSSIGEIMNIAGPPFDWDVPVKYLSKRTAKPYVECRLASSWRCEFDISRARAVLGYQPNYDVIRMIDSAFDYRNGKDLGVIPAA